MGRSDDVGTVSTMDTTPLVTIGEWWLPDRPGDICHGTLRFDQVVGGRLELHGSLDQSDDPDASFGVVALNADSGVHPRIHGRTDEGDITLEDCFVIRQAGSLGGPVHQVIHVNQALVGSRIPRDAQLEFDGVSFGLTFLADWVGGERIERVFGRDGTTDQAYVGVTARALATKSTTLGDGSSVELRHYVGSKGDLTSRTVYYHYRWRIAFPDLRLVRDVLDVVGDIEDLVSLGAQRPNGLVDLRLHHPDGRTEHRGRVRDEGWPFVAKWSSGSVERTRDLPPHEMFFTFTECGEMDGVKAWLDGIPPQRSGLRRVMAARHREGVLLTDQLMAYAASLEQLDRARHKNGDFKTRMRRLIARADPEFSALVGDPERWTAVFKTLRNDCAHNLGKSQIESADLVFISASAYWLYALCILEAAGVQGTRARFAELGDVSWIRPRVRKVLSNSV